MVCIATIASMNYYAQTQVLIESICQNTNYTKICVLVTDYELKEHGLSRVNNCEVLYFSLSDLDISNITEMTFKYNVAELNSSLKPFFINHLLVALDYERVIFVDPDIYVFENFTIAYNLLNDFSIVITPHILYDLSTVNILDYLQHGLYNMGFFAVKRDENTLSFLSWWKNKLIDQCYYDLKNQLCCDQKWMDFAPSLFSGIHILREPSYNVAFWNLHERDILFKDNQFLVNQRAIVFYHYSNFKFKNPEYLAYFKEGEFREFTDNHSVRHLFHLYYNKVMAMNYNHYSNIEYGFHRYDNNAVISNSHRTLYKIKKNEILFGNPFVTNGENSFFSYLLKANLVDKTP
ncbi:MAG: hypothetical protein LBC96_05645 [Lachnospiraceae bacterium]|jgi:hypothetical protein|nr:hypothetical protein [Lachnospiraceae bacterium]